jgi:hypothetical protein
VSYNLYDRYRVNKSTLLTIKHDNQHLQLSFNKYGENNFVFELIEIVDDLDKIYDIKRKIFK